VVKNGRVYTPAGFSSIDLWIKDGRVVALGGPNRAEESIDARGLIVLPGAIDVHVHFRDPGFTYKEDWESGSISAAAGGVTTVVDQPNTDPRVSDRRTFRLKLDIARSHSVVDFGLNGGPGKIEEQVKAGATAIGEIFTYDHSDSALAKILQETEAAGSMATIHAEDGAVVTENMAACRSMHEPSAYSRARPARAEEMALLKVLAGSGRLHICHLSTASGLNVIRQAKRQGRHVSCEVAPHHLLFNVKDYSKQGSFLKMNPPLRRQEDNDSLWAGLRDGTIDILASDHAPHLPEEKKDDIWEAPPGVPGVETLLPMMLMAVKKNMVSLERVVDALSARPAEIFGLSSKGRIEVGRDADLVLIDPKAVTKIRADRLHSRAEWTPYEGKEALFPRTTLVRGQVVFEDGLEARPGFGKFLART
jgi:dihydroorotase